MSGLRRLSPILLLTGFLVLFAPLCSAQEARSRKFALLVGVRDYLKGELVGLANTENDVEDLARILNAQGYRQVVLMTQTRGAHRADLLPTADNIQEQLGSLLSLCKPGDQVVVALSGHGLQRTEKGEPVAYFCPMDALPSKGKNLVKLADLYDQLNRSKADGKLLLVDACRNEPGRGVGNSFEPPAPPKGIAALFSCSKGQKSFESNSLKHGIFFHFVIEGLRGKAANRKGEVTMPGLADYVQSEVPLFVHKAVSGTVRQEPELKGETSGKWVLTIRLTREKDQTEPVRPQPTGDPEKWLQLGLKSDLGLGANIDENKAVEYYHKALALRHPLAPARLASMYAHGRGVKRSLEEADKLAREAFPAVKQGADRKDPVALYTLGVMYAFGRGVLQDEKEAVRLYRLGMEKGSVAAINNLGVMYAQGHGVPQDDREAVRLYQRAAEQGYPAAQNNLGGMYAHGRGVPKNERVAAEWYHKAAERGHAGAQSNLGWMYAHGQGVDKDDRKALEWFRKAGERGDGRALFNLGLIYANGRGVGRDEKEAVRLYRLAAEKGHSGAQNNLGLMYAHGRGVEKDDRQAAEWYRKAAQRGDVNGQANLGMMYADGRGVERDDRKSVELLRAAAVRGHPSAQRNLARMYDEGRGVSRDPNEARAWRSKAEAVRGHGGEMLEPCRWDH
jgi:TPR repeat protein